MIGVMSMALDTVAHIVTLPVEFDASYRKALPILQEGNYLRDGDLQHAEKILKAADASHFLTSPRPVWAF